MGTFMPVRYDQDTKAKAIRLVDEHAAREAWNRES
jgi:hypothetical protein